MNNSKLPEGMTKSQFFEIDDKRVKFPNIRLDIWKQGGVKIILDYFGLTQVQLSGKSDLIFITLFHNLV